MFVRTTIKNTVYHGKPKPLKVNPNGRSTLPLKIPNGMPALNSKKGIKVTKININNCSGIDIFNS